MRSWFADAFGTAAHGLGHGIGDVRDKLVFEGYFGRHVPEARISDGLGWTQAGHAERDDPAKPGHALDPSPNHVRDQDRGVDLDR